MLPAVAGAANVVRESDNVTATPAWVTVLVTEAVPAVNVTVPTREEVDGFAAAL